MNKYLNNDRSDIPLLDYRKILNNLDIGVIIIKDTMSIDYINHKALNIFGYDQIDLDKIDINFLFN